MSGSAFSVLAVVLIGVLAVAVVGAPFLIVLPIALLILIPFVVLPLMRGVKTGKLASAEPTGVPSTSEASFNPQMDPSDRI